MIDGSLAAFNSRGRWPLRDVVRVLVRSCGPAESRVYAGRPAITVAVRTSIDA